VGLAKREARLLPPCSTISAFEEMPARGSVRRLLATTGLVAIVASLAAPASLPATA